MWWQVLLIASGVSLIVGLVVWFFVVPRQRKTIHKKLNSGTLNNTNGTNILIHYKYTNSL